MYQWANYFGFFSNEFCVFHVVLNISTTRSNGRSFMMHEHRGYKLYRNIPSVILYNTHSITHPSSVSTQEAFLCLCTANSLPCHWSLSHYQLYSNPTTDLMATYAGFTTWLIIATESSRSQMVWERRKSTEIQIFGEASAKYGQCYRSTKCLTTPIVAVHKQEALSKRTYPLKCLVGISVASMRL